jgi:hypothetical protein
MATVLYNHQINFQLKILQFLKPVITYSVHEYMPKGRHFPLYPVFNYICVFNLEYHLIYLAKTFTHAKKVW